MKLRVQLPKFVNVLREQSVRKTLMLELVAMFDDSNHLQQWASYRVLTLQLRFLDALLLDVSKCTREMGLRGNCVTINQRPGPSSISLCAPCPHLQCPRHCRSSMAGVRCVPAVEASTLEVRLVGGCTWRRYVVLFVHKHNSLSETEHGVLVRPCSGRTASFSFQM